MTRLPVLLLLLGLGTPQGHAQSTIPATMLKVVDGDTFDAELHPLPDTTRRVRVRVMDLDTPELRGQCAKEREMAQSRKAPRRRIADRAVPAGGARSPRVRQVLKPPGANSGANCYGAA